MTPAGARVKYAAGRTQYGFTIIVENFQNKYIGINAPVNKPVFIMLE